MPFIVKATYRNETRKFTFQDPHFPTYEQLYHQLYRVFSVGHSYYLSKLLFSPQEGTRILIGMEVHSAADYEAHIKTFKGRYYPAGRLTFAVYDETPHKVPASRAPGSFIHPIPPVPPLPFFAPPPPPPPPPQWPFAMPRTYSPPSLPIPMDTSDSETTVKKDSATATTTTECCSVAEGKKEVRTLMETFLRDFNHVMGSTFGEDRSFFDPIGTPTLERRATPRVQTSAPAPEDLEASLAIPGSFIQPRPHSPDLIGDDIEKSQTPPQLEPLQTLHPNTWCDFCGKQIRGLRFKCQECVNYDLCANCIVVNQALDVHNRGLPSIHKFSTISPPTPQEPEPRVPLAPIVPQSEPATAPAVSAPELVVHRNIYCDMCNNTVVGNRHKCLDCPDYDLCDQCIGNAPSQHTSNHEFLKLETPGRVIVHTVAAPLSQPEQSTSPVQHNALCNMCDSRIIGDRYKCTGCPDFDTCAACFAITPDHHPVHVFVKVTRPEDIISRWKPAKAYHSAVCDGCNEDIVGVRYKCMHAECPDFDLCENCEALPIPVHPPTHPFLKLRNADMRIPVVQRRQATKEQTASAAPTPASVTSPAREPTPVPTFVSIPIAEPVATPVQAASPAISHAVAPSPSVSTSVERLHAIRMQAERRLSARRQHLQSYPFAATDDEDRQTQPTVDPTIEERLIRERKEAEEKAQAVDWEIEEREKARQKKHQDAIQGALNALFSPRNATAFSDPVKPLTPIQDNEYPLLEEIEQSDRPQMTQRASSFFASPFIPHESPLKAHFLSDNNIPDGHIFPAGAEFVKSWRVRNDGPEAWVEGTEVIFVGGRRLGAFEGAPTTYEVGPVAPGEQIDVCAGDMKAPDRPGRYLSHWILRDPQGRMFGPRIWCDIEVLEFDSDHSQHSSLVNSAVVMPETAPEQSPSVANATPNPFSNPSSPITLPSSAVTVSEAAPSDDGSSSVGSVSLVEHSDSDWDDVPDAPSPQRQVGVPRPQTGRADDDVEYLVLYDSSDSDDA